MQEKIEVALEVRCGLDVHAGRMARTHIALAILAAAEETVEDVILVGCDAKTGSGQAHTVRQPASEDVAEVAGGHDELHVSTFVIGQPQPCPNIIDALCQHARDVNGIYGGKIVRIRESGIAKYLLHDALRVIKS